MSEPIRFCQTRDGVRIAYAKHGRGPVLVKVAHFLSHLELDWLSPVYRHWIHALSARRTLVCYDARDTGMSDREVDPVSLDAWVRDLEAVVDDLALERFPLLAFCQAGPIAIEYAARHPDRVSQLVLYGTYAQGRLRRDPSPEQRREVEALLTLVGNAWSRDSPEIRQWWTSRFIPEGSLEQVRWFNEALRWSASTAAAICAMRARYNVDVLDRAAQVTAPTLVLHNRGDTFVPFESGRQLAATIPHASFVPLDGRNHLLLADEPAWPRLLRELDQFLAAPTVPTVPAAGGLSGLTAREHELLDLIAAGADNAAIADRLVISPKTVRNHITHVFDKLGVTTRAQAIVVAREAGLGLLRERVRSC